MEFFDIYIEDMGRSKIEGEYKGGYLREKVKYWSYHTEDWSTRAKAYFSLVVWSSLTFMIIFIFYFFSLQTFEFKEFLT